MIYIFLDQSKPPPLKICILRSGFIMRETAKLQQQSKGWAKFQCYFQKKICITFMICLNVRATNQLFIEAGIWHLT